MKKVALLIGCNYYNTPSLRLHGCINDVENIQKMLRVSYNYTPEEIIVMRDDLPTEDSLYPTRLNLYIQLMKITKESGNYNELWVYYSGHGSLVYEYEDTNKSYAANNIIIPPDYKKNGVITDDDMRVFVENLQCKTLLMFDSCHSGTICDLPWKFDYNDGISFIRSRLTENKELQNKNIYVISGCRDEQTSIDYYDFRINKYYGEFTHALLMVLKENNYKIPLLKLYNDTYELIKKQGFTQRPLFCSSNPDPSRFLFTGSPPPKHNTISSVPFSAQNLIKRSMEISVMEKITPKIFKTNKKKTMNPILEPTIKSKSKLKTNTHKPKPVKHINSRFLLQFNTTKT